MIGQTVFHYKVLEKLGEGGMGIVYKAHDTKLDRDVALKFLPHHLTATADEQARFLQEARAASALNHPNVCTIYDIAEHDGPASAGAPAGRQQFIVMEYIDGKTLRQMLPVQKTQTAINYAIQIGEALQEAHSKGIVHRDIKTDNIMVNSKNQIKVMDFGLAKLKGSLKLTKTSSTVGTLAYMAPEQIEGGEVDARSDIFSFGVVLYEVLTGHLPFRGEHEAAMVYSIVNEEPIPVQRYLSDISPELVHILGRALEKDSGDRYQNVAEMVIDLRRLKKETTRVSRVDVFQSRQTRQGGLLQYLTTPKKKLTILTATVVVVLCAVVAILILSRSPQPESARPPLQSSMRVQQLTDQVGMEEFPDISSDGSFIAYSKTHADGSDIFLKRVAGGKPIKVTNDPHSRNYEPSFSPDGQFIAFRSSRDGGGLFVMGSTGESVRKLTDEGYYPSWSPDGSSILYCTDPNPLPFDRNIISKLWSVNVRTGEKRLLFEGDAMQPQSSPHGYRIAFWVLGSWGPAGKEGIAAHRDIWTMASNGGDFVAVTSDAYIDWNPIWSPDGKYLYFLSDRGGSMNLWRVAINELSGKTLAEPEPLTTPARQMGRFRMALDGKRFVYESRDFRSAIFAARFDPMKEAVVGTPNRVAEFSKAFIQPSLSPDGEWIVLSTTEDLGDIHVIKKDGTEMRQLTSDAYRDRSPSWSPDGKEIAFYSNRGGQIQIWTIRPDGSGLRQVTNVPSRAGPWSPKWFPDQSHIVFYNSTGTFIVDLSKPLEDRRAEKVELNLPPGSSFREPSISRDGQKLVGVIVDSLETPKQIAVYVLSTREFDTLSISGSRPIWLNDGRRVLYVDRGKLCIADTRSSQSHILYSLPGTTEAEDLTLSFDNRTLYFVTRTNEVDLWMGTLK
jgi:serine/threonine protein kinase